MDDQKVKQVNKYDLQYGVLCSKLGDLEAQKLFIELEIKNVKQNILKLNELAGKAVKKVDNGGQNG